MTFDPGVLEWLIGAAGVVFGIPLLGIGSIIGGLFGKKKESLQSFTKSQPIQNAITADVGRQQRYGAANEADINAVSPIYRSLYDQQAPQAANASQSLYDLGNRISANSGVNDPLAYYRQMGDYATGKLDGFIKSSLQAVPLGYKLSQAQRSPSAGGTFARKQFADAAYARTLPYYSQVLNNIGSQAGNLYAQESSRIGQVPGLYNAATSLPFNATRYLTAPIALRGQAGAQDANILSILQRIEDANNIRGIKSEDNWANRLMNAENNFLDTAGKAAGVAGNIFGGILGGGAGGGIGGLLGGGGGQAPSPAVQQPQSTLWASPGWA